MKTLNRLSSLAFGSLLVLACGDDATEGDDTNGTTTGTPTTTDSGVTLTTTQTTGPTTDPTTDPDTTTGDDDPTAEDDTTTGETTGDETTGDETTDGTTGGEDPFWQPCFGDDDACGRDEVCLFGFSGNIANVSFCAADCTTAEDCPPPPGGSNAQTACISIDEDSLCIIECSNTEDCPTDMECFAGACGHPTNWTCAAAFYGDGEDCDCGCGITDPDCTDMTLASCDFCAEIGSCSDEACEGNMQIDPNDNAVCL